MDIEVFLKQKPQWAYQPCLYIVKQMFEGNNAYRCGLSGGLQGGGGDVGDGRRRRWERAHAFIVHLPRQRRRDPLRDRVALWGLFGPLVAAPHYLRHAAHSRRERYVEEEEGGRRWSQILLVA